MKIKLLHPIIALSTVALMACGSTTPQTPPETATAAQPSPQPTQTTAPTETVTPVPTESATEPPAPVNEAESQTVSFSGNIMPILETYCIKCHGLERVREGLNMTTYDNLMTGSFNGPVVVPGNADESLLVELIANNEMPDRGPKVTPEELQIIINWVNQGALNN
jgi:hypothetical protein